MFLRCQYLCQTNGPGRGSFILLDTTESQNRLELAWFSLVHWRLMHKLYFTDLFIKTLV